MSPEHLPFPASVLKCHSVLSPPIFSPKLYAHPEKVKGGLSFPIQATLRAKSPFAFSAAVAVLPKAERDICP